MASSFTIINIIRLPRPTEAEAKARLANWLRTVEDVGGLHTLGH